MKRKIVICGLGAIGSNMIHNLAADSRGYTYHVIEYDKVEHRNIQAGTQRYYEDQVGMTKVDATKTNIWSEFKVAVWGKSIKLERGSVLSFADVDTSKALFIDAFDNSEARNNIQELGREYSFPVLHVGFSPQKTFDIIWDEKYTATDDSNLDIDICEMPGAASFIQYVVGLASIIVQEYLASGEKISVTGSFYRITKL